MAKQKGLFFPLTAMLLLCAWMLGKCPYPPASMEKNGEPVFAASSSYCNAQGSFSRYHPFIERLCETYFYDDPYGTEKYLKKAQFEIIQVLTGPQPGLNDETFVLLQDADNGWWVIGSEIGGNYRFSFPFRAELERANLEVQSDSDGQNLRVLLQYCYNGVLDAWCSRTYSPGPYQGFLEETSIDDPMESSKRCLLRESGLLEERAAVYERENSMKFYAAASGNLDGAGTGTVWLFTNDFKMNSPRQQDNYMVTEVAGERAYLRLTPRNVCNLSVNLSDMDGDGVDEIVTNYQYGTDSTLWMKKVYKLTGDGIALLLQDDSMEAYARFVLCGKGRSANGGQEWGMETALCVDQAVRANLSNGREVTAVLFNFGQGHDLFLDDHGAYYTVNFDLPKIQDFQIRLFDRDGKPEITLTYAYQSRSAPLAQRTYALHGDALVQTATTDLFQQAMEDFLLQNEDAMAALMEDSDRGMAFDPGEVSLTQGELWRKDGNVQPILLISLFPSAMTAQVAAYQDSNSQWRYQHIATGAVDCRFDLADFSGDGDWELIASYLFNGATKVWQYEIYQMDTTAVKLFDSLEAPTNFSNSLTADGKITITNPAAKRPYEISAKLFPEMKETYESIIEMDSIPFTWQSGWMIPGDGIRHLDLDHDGADELITCEYTGFPVMGSFFGYPIGRQFTIQKYNPASARFQILDAAFMGPPEEEFDSSLSFYEQQEAWESSTKTFLTKWIGEDFLMPYGNESSTIQP